MTHKRWTKEEEIQLVELIDQRLSYLNIALNLNRTISSVRNKCHLLRLYSKEFELPIGYQQMDGFLEVIERLDGDKIKCICHCCGNYWIGKRKYVTNGNNKSCGCLETKKICPICNHINSNGFCKICIKCGYKFDKNCKSLTEEYPDIAIDWDYKQNTINPNHITAHYSKRVFWICNKCKYKWSVSPHFRTSKNKTGCPKCCSSQGENKICEILDKYNIKYEQEKRFSKCKHKKKLRFDFYLLDCNILLEYQGIQHYPEKYKKSNFNNLSKFGYRHNKTDIRNIQKRDQIKRDFCKKENIRLLEIPYWDFDNIEDILCKELNINQEDKEEINKKESMDT